MTANRVASSPRWKTPRIALIAVMLGLGLLLPSLFIFPTPKYLKDGRPGDWGPPQLGSAHVLGLALYACALDNNGQWPTGDSSTTVFQKLIDDGYITDPGILYFPLPGKVKAAQGQKLKPENVCWDITAGVTHSDSDDLPVVLMTGWRMNYSSYTATSLLQTPAVLELDFNEIRINFWGWRKNYTQQNLYPGCLVFAWKGSSSHVVEFRSETPFPSVSLRLLPGKTLKQDRTHVQLAPDGVLK